jgi:pSer/pThr/pTyr-binding forkhead associated (FHA) protein
MEKKNQEPKAFLIVIRQIHPLAEGKIRVGRGLDNQLTIDDPSVSRDHMQVVSTEGGFLIQDLGSTGGTFVNGEKIDRRPLISGDIISLAGVTMLFIEDSPMPLDTSRLRRLQL